jgi:hypothetical protein
MSASGGGGGVPRASATSRVGGAWRFHGQTSWQMSQPKSQSPIGAWNSSAMAPRCSIVRYAMQRRASSAYGAGSAPVGHAVRHAVHVPQ